MTKENICPGCGRHCDLNEPHCIKGKEYHYTEEMLEKWHGKEQHDRTRMAHCQAEDMNNRLVISLRDLGHMMRFLYEGKASQKRILIILNEMETVTQKNLTRRLGIKPGSTSEILSKLENAGLILRNQNKADRRTIDICLTDEGKKLATEALAQRQKRHEEMFSCLSGEEKHELLSLLERVCDDWRTHYFEAGNSHWHGRYPHGHHGSGHAGRDYGDYHGHGGI